MPNVTQYICQPYGLTPRGGLKPEPPVACTSEANARLRAERMLENHRAVGVDVVRQDADPAVGEYGEPEFLARLGRVPALD
ncbi:MAG: hypothetical protein GC191_18500 [Azospirillum sp.]|nr:hypothetical protein [Azospirillum sp.]